MDTASVVGFVVAVVSVLLAPLAAVAFALGLAGIARTGDAGRRGRGLAMSAVLLGSVVGLTWTIVLGGVAVSRVWER